MIGYRSKPDGVQHRLKMYLNLCQRLWHSLDLEVRSLLFTLPQSWLSVPLWTYKAWTKACFPFQRGLHWAQPKVHLHGYPELLTHSSFCFCYRSLSSCDPLIPICCFRRPPGKTNPRKPPPSASWPHWPPLSAIGSVVTNMAGTNVLMTTAPAPSIMQVHERGPLKHLSRGIWCKTNPSRHKH